MGHGTAESHTHSPLGSDMCLCTKKSTKINSHTVLVRVPAASPSDLPTKYFTYQRITSPETKAGIGGEGRGVDKNSRLLSN